MENNRLQTGILHTRMTKKDHPQNVSKEEEHASHCATIPADGY
jgi:hypothetical protein